MRLCASLFRGVAAPLGCVIFFASAEIAVCTSCAQGFLRVRGEGWYHYPRRALRVVETLGARLSKGLSHDFRFFRLLTVKHELAHAMCSPFCSVAGGSCLACACSSCSFHCLRFFSI